MQLIRSASRGLFLAPLAACLAATPALAQDAPVPDSGNTAFLLISAVLVLFMSLPGIALFYGGMVRAKNMLSVLSQVLAIMALTSIIWIVYGYSLAFTNGGGLNSFVGGFDKLFLSGVDASSLAATFSNGVYVPEYAYIAFQAAFACLTPAILIGALVERTRFSAILLFTALWLTFVYFPIAHMVWYWAGPDALADAARAVQEATDEAARAAALANLAAVEADAGLIFKWGALDFAGGTVIHINSGIAGLVGAIMIGKRIGYGKEALPPHSLPMTLIGTAVLWVGWFGFNAGSNLEANGGAALAFVNTLFATAGGILGWLIVEWTGKGKPSMLGMASGAISGLVAITPAAGFAGPVGAAVLGFVGGAVCFYFVSKVKNALGYDDSLDVFGIHGVGGIVGAIGTGIVVAPALGGAGLVDYVTSPGEAVSVAVNIGEQVWAQIKGVLLTIVWSGIGSAIIFKIVDLVVGLRVSPEVEREGLDVAEHGERAYNL
ncbi:ammonium transporter [Pseudochelatococcus contaminans]|uniref:Ammonium transporter n=1 Tax=Pseudochelatococcus contaminans TaxID=1538103 RepID=A0A7W6EFJ8_9HYPH|nr:ammonium transporter [Pseudochelatococcus contaminans]MBB3808878.1 Amt family ammonium transporter [Pseudochelatococcus contaminans]